MPRSGGAARMYRPGASGLLIRGAGGVDGGACIGARRGGGDSSLVECALGPDDVTDSVRGPGVRFDLLCVCVVGAARSCAVPPCRGQSSPPRPPRPSLPRRPRPPSAAARCVRDRRLQTSPGQPGADRLRVQLGQRRHLVLPRRRHRRPPAPMGCLCL